ncbi:MAG: AAA family ATPase [Syntrophomonadaceae bacterium]|nr:AAA family ATPase [Syntrophomonadaceae bacterium]
MKRLIQVCGDPTVDWFRIHNDDVTVRGGVYYWQRHNEDMRVRLSSKPGGSALVLQLIKAMVSPELAQVDGPVLEDELLNRPRDRRITTSWTLWKELPNHGFAHSSFRLWQWHEFEPVYWDYPSARLNGYPDLLVVQDSGLGFRSCPEGWPEVLSLSGHGPEPGHIIYKLGQYYDKQENPVLNRIIEKGWSDSTSIVTSLSDLRACAVKIGVSLSWERMLEEIVLAVLSPNCPFLDPATQRIKFKQVIVPIGTSGVVIVGRDYNTLVFDRNGQEGDFASLVEGQMIGDNTCVLCSLATAWAEDPEGIDWARAACLGTILARLVLIKGYDVVMDGYKHLQFPYQTIATTYRELTAGHGISAGLPYRNRIADMGIFIDKRHLATTSPGNWTILENTLLQGQDSKCCLSDPQSIKAVNDCARSIVIQGPQAALRDVPLETIGSWYSADRQEIEGVRSVNNAMRGYLQQKHPATPLCVAVFGPPGAGKSFAIKEIARGLGMGEANQLTFNLSQFESADELTGAFNQIRDLNVKGKTPLVFWDEFDTPYQGRTLGWLRYFLAPMQDGEFTSQGITHPLGGGIYVFAGATRHSFAEFLSRNTSEDRAAKKPDFISRLSAFINIRGINGNPNTVEDRLYMIRRAFILRQYLETNAPQINHDNQFLIENGVLDALLLISKYRHGTRSLENLLKMSSLADKRKYELSSLPPEHIIEMHVNSQEFNDLIFWGHHEMLRIGIRGHVRLDPRETEKLQQAVDAIIAFIKQQYPQYYLLVFSDLAVGANRLLARAFMKIEASRLIAVLPLSEAAYVRDFGSIDKQPLDDQDEDLRGEYEHWQSRDAMEIIEMPFSPTRQEAYLKAGNYIAEHSDLMIVAWDGDRDNHSSCTTRIVARAEELNLPIFHIWTSNGEPNCHGQVRYKNFPGQPAGEWQKLQPTPAT